MRHDLTSTSLQRASMDNEDLQGAFWKYSVMKWLSKQSTFYENQGAARVQSLDSPHPSESIGAGSFNHVKSLQELARRTPQWALCSSGAGTGYGQSWQLLIRTWVWTTFLQACKAQDSTACVFRKRRLVKTHQILDSYQRALPSCQEGKEIDFKIKK